MRNEDDGLRLSLKISKTQISNRNIDLKQFKTAFKPLQSSQLGIFDSSPKNNYQIRISKYTSPKNGKLV